MNVLKKLALVIIALTLLIVAVGYLYLSKLIAPYSQGVHSSIKATYMAMYSSEITGSYWENKMFDEYNSNVRSKPISERLDYYLAILVQDDLDTSKATVFVDMVGEDSKDFGQLLRNIESHPANSTLDAKGKDRIKVWKNNFN